MIAWQAFETDPDCYQNALKCGVILAETEDEAKAILARLKPETEEISRWVVKVDEVLYEATP